MLSEQQLDAFATEARKLSQLYGREGVEGRAGNAGAMILSLLEDRRDLERFIGERMELRGEVSGQLVAERR